MTPVAFRKIVWEFYKKYGRHDLPWRGTHDAYRILVSEVMLQQTQVERVIPFYKNFLKQFPTVRVLAAAPLSEVLIAWQGLGYNRRAKMLHETAKLVVKEHKGKMPTEPTVLNTLPGVGPYTARAVATFAANADVVFIETNLRTVVTHHFFPKKEKVDDAEILNILEQALPKGKSREWYAALMDYGSYLKRSGVRINAKSKTYSKQKSFTGSAREARGAILRKLSERPATEAVLMQLLGPERVEQMQMQLKKLLAEGLITKKDRTYWLPT